MRFIRADDAPVCARLQMDAGMNDALSDAGTARVDTRVRESGAVDMELEGERVSGTYTSSVPAIDAARGVLARAMATACSSGYAAAALARLLTAF